MKCVFFDFQVCKSRNQQYRKKARVEFCKRKAFNRLSNTRMFSLHYAADTFEPELRSLILLLDSRLNIFHTNDSKAIISLQNVRKLDRHRRKYIACFYSTQPFTSYGSCDTKIIFRKHAPRWPRRSELAV